MKAQIGKSMIILLEGDITDQDTEAIVNAANPSLLGGGGVDGAIHGKGGLEILDECRKIRLSLPEGLQTGEAVITTAGKLKARKVIHAVGPVWRGGNKGEPELLEKAYRSCLSLALKEGLKIVSFPSISTGAFGYPILEASRIAIRTVVDFLRKNKGIDEVRFVLHSHSDYHIYERSMEELNIARFE